MNVLDYLDKLRGYPEARRQKILIVSTSLITLAIILLWLLNVWLVNTYEPKTKPAGPGMLDTLTTEINRIKTGFTEVKSSVGNFNKK